MAESEKFRHQPESDPDLSFLQTRGAMSLKNSTETESPHRSKLSSRYIKGGIIGTAAAMSVSVAAILGCAKKGEQPESGPPTSRPLVTSKTTVSPSSSRQDLQSTQENIVQRKVRAEVKNFNTLFHELESEHWEIGFNSADELVKIGRAAVPDLIEILSAKNTKINARQHAIRALGEIGDTRAVPALTEMLQAENERVRWFAVRALSEVCDARALQPLIAALKHQKIYVSKPLIRIGQPAVPSMIEIVKNKNDDRGSRMSAVNILGEIGGEMAFQFLLDAQKNLNDDRELNHCIIRALGDLGDNRATLDLIDRLQTPEYLDEFKRSNVAEALGKIGDKRAVGALIEGHCFEATDALIKIGGNEVIDPLLKSLESGNPSYDAFIVLGTLKELRAFEGMCKYLGQEDSHRELAVRGLGLLGDSRAVDLLIERITTDKSEFVRCSSALALGRLHNKKAIPVLMAALHDHSKEVREHAIWGLGQMNDKAAISPLLAQLKGEDVISQIDAARALGELRYASVVPQLIEALGGRSAGLDGAVIEALTKIGDKSAVIPLVECLKKGNRCAWEASEALEQIGDERAIPALIQITNDENLHIVDAALQAIKHIQKVQSEKKNPVVHPEQ